MKSLDELDIVYPYKTDGIGEELRYSLRSLKNIPHKNVWVVGDKEDWFSDEIRYVRFDIESSIGKTKYSNVNTALIALSIWDEKEYSGRDNLTQDYILFNDDFFVMQKLGNQIPRMYHGTLYDKLNELQSNPWTKTNKIYIDELRSALETLKSLNKPILNYELHLPMVFNQEKYAEIFSQFKGSAARRSLYGNIYNTSYDKPFGEIEIGKDCKIYGKDEIFDDDSIFVSTTYHSFYGKAGDKIKEVFTERSIYER